MTSVAGVVSLTVLRMRVPHCTEQEGEGQVTNCKGHPISVQGSLLIPIWHACQAVKILVGHENTAPAMW